jgi:undecaprenyl diphosphate synthase
VGGVDSVRAIVRAAPDLDVGTLTLYAFSSDNWKRPSAEIGRLFWLLREYCKRERAELIDNGVRVTHVGRRDRIPASALAELDRTMTATADGHRLHLRLAIDYSSRWAMGEAARQIALRIAEGSLAPDAVNAECMHSVLVNGVPEPDLIVRTAGEQRLSDFLLWESAYAELYFTPVLWPDFRRDDLANAVTEFRRRVRRFGAVVEVMAPQEPQARAS